MLQEVTNGQMTYDTAIGFNTKVFIKIFKPSAGLLRFSCSDSFIYINDYNVINYHLTS